MIERGREGPHQDLGLLSRHLDLNPLGGRDRCRNRRIGGRAASRHAAEKAPGLAEDLGRRDLAADGEHHPFRSVARAVGRGDRGVVDARERLGRAQDGQRVRMRTVEGGVERVDGARRRVVTSLLDAAQQPLPFPVHLVGPELRLERELRHEAEHVAPEARERRRTHLRVVHVARRADLAAQRRDRDRKSTRLNSSHLVISYAVFCLKKKKKKHNKTSTQDLSYINHPNYHPHYSLTPAITCNTIQSSHHINLYSTPETSIVTTTCTLH